jgi:hypothetical protein
VTNKKSKAALKTNPVCSGDIPPHTTIAVASTFLEGSPSDVCKSDPDQYGLTSLDWSKCDFASENVPVVR